MKFQHETATVQHPGSSHMSKAVHSTALLASYRPYRVATSSKTFRKVVTVQFTYFISLPRTLHKFALSSFRSSRKHVGGKN